MSSSRKKSYEVVAAKSFLKDLQHLSKTISQRILKTVEELGENPFLGRTLRGELRGYYSLRVGAYRVIYTVDLRSRRVILRLAEHRRGAYRQ